MGLLWNTPVKKKLYLQRMQLTSNCGSHYSCRENNSTPNFVALSTPACMPLLPLMHIKLAFLCYHSAAILHSYPQIDALVHATNPACFLSNSSHSNDRKHLNTHTTYLQYSITHTKPSEAVQRISPWLQLLFSCTCVLF